MRRISTPIGYGDRAKRLQNRTRDTPRVKARASTALPTPHQLRANRIRQLPHFRLEEPLSP